MTAEIALLTPVFPAPHKPLLIYLPGMDGVGTLFHRQIPSLAPRFDIRCLSISPNDRSNWGQLTEATIALIQNARQPQSHRKIYLCGESFGGCLALKISEQAPELAYQLILSNPATAFARQSFIGFGASLTPWVPDWFYRSSTLGFLPLLIVPHRTDASDRARLLRAMQSLSPGSVSWRLSLLHRFQFAADRLQSHSPKILILASGSDRLMPSVVEAQRLQRRLSEARIHYLPDSGHACLMERDLNLAQILKGRGLLPPLLEKVTV